MPKIAIRGIPFDANSSFMRGAALGPNALIKAFHSSSANYCTLDGKDLQSFKDQWMEEKAIDFSSDDPKAAYQAIFQDTQRLLKEGMQILSIGGDHSITFPIIAAYATQYPHLNILQIDAHDDLYHNFEGNYYSHASPFARIMENGLARSLYQIGIRTLTPHQKEQAEKFNVYIVTPRTLDLNKLALIEGPLYVSLDLDALDPAFAPGVSHHEPGGLTTREVLDIIGGIGVEIIGADIVELNPSRDLNGVTAMVGAKMLKELMAKMI